MTRQNISSGSKFEPVVGYSLAVKVGNHIWVSGTTAFVIEAGEGKIVGIGDPYAQTIQIFKNIEEALTKTGAKMADVVRTRIYVHQHCRLGTGGQGASRSFWVNPSLLYHACPRHGLGPRPGVEISKLIKPEMLVEIEVEAMIGE